MWTLVYLDVFRQNMHYCWRTMGPAKHYLYHNNNRTFDWHHSKGSAISNEWYDKSIILLWNSWQTQGDKDEYDIHLISLISSFHSNHVSEFLIEDLPCRFQFEMCGDILEFFIRPVLQHTMESLLDIGRRDETLSQEVERIEGFTCFSLVLLFCFQTVDQVDEFLECDDSITVLKMELLMSSLPSVVILRIRKICIPAESPCCGRNFGTKILKIGFQENGFWS